MENKLIIFSYIVLGLVSSYCLAVYVPTIQSLSMQQLYKNFAVLTYLIFLFSSITGVIVYGANDISDMRRRRSSIVRNVSSEGELNSPRALTSTNIAELSRNTMTKTEHLHHYIMFMQLSLAVPLYVAHFWIKYHFIGDNMAYSLIAYGVFLSVYYLFTSSVEDEYQNIHIACCTYSLFLIAYDRGSQNLLISTGFIAFGFWVLREFHFMGPLSPNEVYTLSMAIALLASARYAAIKI